jgi:endo-alpha-1,4-polygalactosaminidase (GH114 family)
MLLEAMQILEEETCKECGNPVWVCRNESASNVGFKVKVATCFAKAELDRWNEREEKKKTSKKRHGEYPYVVAYTYDGSDMPTRSQFYKEMAEKYKVE